MLDVFLVFFVVIEWFDLLHGFDLAERVFGVEYDTYIEAVKKRIYEQYIEVHSRYIGLAFFVYIFFEQELDYRVSKLIINPLGWYPAFGFVLPKYESIVFVGLGSVVVEALWSPFP